jgi:hypothetical protein
MARLDELTPGTLVLDKKNHRCGRVRSVVNINNVYVLWTYGAVSCVPARTLTVLNF